MDKSVISAINLVKQFSVITYHDLKELLSHRSLSVNKIYFKIHPVWLWTARDTI